MSKVNLAYIQAVDQGSKEANLNNLITKAAELASKGANVVVTQELFLSAYFCQEPNPDRFDYAIELKGEEVQELIRLAKDLGIVLVVSLFEKRAKGVYHNTAIVIDDNGQIMGEYRKNHIPDDPGYFEKYYFAPGDTDYPVFETKFGKFGVLICFDQWFPEAARIMALKGADFIVYPTAIGWDMKDDNNLQQDELDAWVTVQRSHAIANGIFIMAVNRTGVENQTCFWGNSFVCDPLGRVINRAGEEEVSEVVSLDLSEIEKTRKVWTFLRDRRVDTYDGILKRFIDE